MVKFLLNNKDLLGVVFTIIGSVAAILLGIMALILTSNSNKTSAAQLRIAQRELALSEVQAKPRFRTLWKRSPDPADSSSTYDYVELWNDGPALTSLFLMQISFLEVTPNKVGMPWKIKHIPVYYLFNRQFTGEGSGLLVTLSAYQSPPTYGRALNVTTKFHQLQQQLSEIGYAMRLRVFLDITYSNIFGESGEKMFEATGQTSDLWFSGPAFARVLPQSATRQLVHEWFAINVENLTAESVQEELQKRSDLSNLLNSTALGNEAPDSASPVEQNTPRPGR